MVHDEDLITTDLTASATSILECQHLLADEVSALQIDDTLRASRLAIAACECGRDAVVDSFVDSRAPSVAIH